MKNIHDSLIKPIKLKNESWHTYDGPITVRTQSGCIYRVTSDGAISGGSREIEDGKLWGAIYHPKGPIKMDQIDVGLSIEIKCTNGKKLYTTPVVEILRADD